MIPSMQFQWLQASLPIDPDYNLNSYPVIRIMWSDPVIRGCRRDSFLQLGIDCNITDTHLVVYLGHFSKRRNFYNVDVLMSRENNCLPLQWWQEADLYIHEEATLESNGIMQIGIKCESYVCPNIYRLPGRIVASGPAGTQLGYVPP